MLMIGSILCVCFLAGDDYMVVYFFHLTKKKKNCFENGKYKIYFIQKKKKKITHTQVELICVPLYFAVNINYVYEKKKFVLFLYILMI